MKISKKTKYEINSFIHTFLAVFVPLLVVSFDSLDVNNITKEGLVALFVALLRSTIKGLSTVYFSK